MYINNDIFIKIYYMYNGYTVYFFIQIEKVIKGQSQISQFTIKRLLPTSFIKIMIF